MQEYGGFFKRFIVYMIDNLVFLIPGIFAGNNEMAQLMVYFGFGTLYFVWMNGTYGASLGKMVMKLKITREDGSKIDYKDAFLREIASYLSIIVFGLGFLNIIWNKRKQGWHDIIAKTIVVKS